MGIETGPNIYEQPKKEEAKIEQPRFEKPEEQIEGSKEEKRQKWAESIAKEVKELQRERPIEEVIMKWAKYAGKNRKDWTQDMFERVPKILEKEDPERRMGEAKNVLEQRLKDLRTLLEKKETPKEKIGEIQQRISEAEEILSILGVREEKVKEGNKNTLETQIK